MPFPSGDPKEVVSGLSRTGFRTFAWFPDNRRILYSQRDANDIHSLIVHDIRANRRRTIFVAPMLMVGPAVSPGGTRIALSGGLLEWGLVEISLRDAKVHPLLTRFGIQYYPDWSPDGKHYLFSTNAGGASEIVDRSAADGSTRRVVSLETEGLPRDVEYFSQSRWSPDGERFAFTAAKSANLRSYVSNAAGGRAVPIDTSVEETSGPAWSPDGQWLAYVRHGPGRLELAKIQPGVSSGATIISKATLAPDDPYRALHWSPAGILYLSPDGMALVDPENRAVRPVTGLKFSVYGSSRDGRSVYGILRSHDPKSAEWTLYHVDVQTGKERLVGALDLPVTTNLIAGLSLHPSGDRFVTSILKQPYDIWMLESFEPPRNWLDRLLRR